MQREELQQRVIRRAALARGMLHGHLDRPPRVEHGQRGDERAVLLPLDHRRHDAAVVAAEHAAEVRERDAREPPHHRVRQPRGVAPEEGVLPAFADRVDQVVPLAERRDDLRDFLGRVLQVRVERDDPLSARGLEAGHDRGVLAEVPREGEHAQLRVDLPLLAEQLQRPVGRAVVHRHDLVRFADPVEHGEQPREERLDVRRLVEHRDHDRQPRVTVFHDHSFYHQGTRTPRTTGTLTLPHCLLGALVSWWFMCAAITRFSARTTSSRSSSFRSG